MKRLIAALAVLALSPALTHASAADASPGGIEDNWLMLVGTRNTDSTREADFNRWYNDIDIPDVLKVPGYKRARRALRQAPALPEGDGPYIALYDIATPNIDRTIIDMLMASKKMDLTGRSTDLLKVTERVYFRQAARAYEAPHTTATTGKSRYVFLERVACCRDDATERQLNDWFDTVHMPDMTATPGLVRATRYQLYRVLMVEPRQVPHFLTVYELDADSAAQAMAAVHTQVSKLRTAGRMSEWFVEGDSAVYQMIRDVKAGDASTPARSGGDVTLVNGQVFTPSGWKTALNVKDGKIVAVGSDAQIRKLAPAGATVVDLKGHTVMPGMYDMHVHPMMASNGEDGACRIEQGVSADALLSAVAGCVKAARPGAWVTGGQWQAVSMGTTPITAQTLDKVSPNNPVMLFDISGHSVWANSQALKAAGVTRDMPNPEGGLIERNAAGEATGILRETARDLVLRLVPPPTAEQNVVALKTSLNLLLSKGVTGLTDAMVFRDGLVAYDTLADRGELHQTVRACIAYSHAGKLVPGFDELLAARQSFARPGLQADCVKVFTDGVPTESHTAAMLEPYADDPGSAPARGMLLVDPKTLNPAVAQWDKMGLTVLFHAAGDGAVRAALDSIEFARQANGAGGPSHQVGHSTFISKQDMPRAKALGATIEFSPYLWYPSPINDDIIKAIGPARIERVWPLREGIASGATIVAGSDWDVVPSPDPWLAIETSITRKAPEVGGAAFGPAEAITLQQAIQVFTLNAAAQMGMRDQLGSLEAGKQADFIVLDRNPFRIPATDLHSVTVNQTWIAGTRVFERAN